MGLSSTVRARSSVRAGHQPGLPDTELAGMQTACSPTHKVPNKKGGREWGPHVCFLLYGPVKDLMQRTEARTCAPHPWAVTHLSWAAPGQSPHFRLRARPGRPRRCLQAPGGLAPGGLLTGPAFPQPAPCLEPAGEPVPGAVTLPLEGACHHKLARGDRPRGLESSGCRGPRRGGL